MDTRLPDAGELWRLTMDHSPIGMAVVSLDGQIVAANVALHEMLGHAPGALTATTLAQVTHPDDRDEDANLVARTLRGELESYRTTKRFVRADGSVVIGDLSVALLRREGDRPIHFIAQVVDRTERHDLSERLGVAEEIIATEAARVEALFDAAGVGLLLVDGAGRVLAHNRQHQEFLELAFPEGHRGLPGQMGHVYDADQTRLLRREEMPSTRASAGESFQDLVVWLGEDPDSRRALSVTARPVRDRTGVVIGTAVASQDITDLMRASRVKDAFVSAVSHGLRTPLASAMAYLELLGDTVGDQPDTGEKVDAVLRNMLRLSHMIADLILATRAMSGSTVIDRYQVDLAAVVDEAVESAQVAAASAGIHLASDRPAALVVVADGLRLRQVLDDLISNAILFGRRDGHVDVHLVESGGEVVLTVSDDGEGIDPDDLERVFERFFRGENARRRSGGGTGLGLHVVRTVVEAHGGEVTLDSMAGEGTTVRVSLPR